MGVDWCHIGILQHWEILVLKDAHQERIIPLAQYRDTIISTLHSTGRKSATLMETIKKHYYWPKMRQQITEHVAQCKSCLILMPSKTRTQALGLDVKLSDLEPMDWLVTDLFESQAVSGGKNKNWIAIADRASGFCWA